MSKDQLITRDYLALERTRLANERTFLAYFRTTVVFLASGLSIIQFEYLREIYEVGWGLALLAPIVLGVGFLRFIYVKRAIRKFYQKALGDS